MTTKEFGIRLYHLRRHKTLYNHRQMAILLKIERSTYTKYETGQSEPSLEMLEKIRKILGVSYNQLLGMPLKEEEIADYEMFKTRRNQKQEGL